MTNSSKTSLEGKQERSGCCTPICCLRVWFGLMIERFGYSGGKGIRISVVVESFRALFYWTFFVVLLTGVILTKMFVTDDATAVILTIFGAKNACSYVDFPPSTYVLPFLYLFPMAFGIIYSVLSMFRILIAYDEGRITVLEKKLLMAVHVYLIFSFMLFELIFAVSPDLDKPTTIYIHSLPYFNMKIALWALQIGVVYFGTRVAWKDNKSVRTWFVVVSWIHVALLFITMVISNAIIMNALLDIGKGRWWSVHDPYNFWMAEITGNIGGVVLMLVIPLFQSHVLASHGFRTHHVTFQITGNKGSSDEHVN